MSRYFAHARTVARALETAVARVTPAPQALPVPVGTNIELAGGAIRFIDAARASTEPASWLGVFEAALEHGATVAPETLGLMDSRGSRYALADLLPSPEARRRFVQMLRPRRGLYAALSAMHDCRLLERLITGFGRISGRMIRDFYHKYTVDEHTLLTVRGIERLVTKPAKRPRFAELLAELRSPERLVLALLLHDIGKWKDENHAEESARMAQVIFDELGLDGETRHDVEFLIVQHLEMSRVTFRRDNSDARVIRQFADLVGTEDAAPDAVPAHAGRHRRGGPGHADPVEGRPPVGGLRPHLQRADAWLRRQHHCRWRSGAGRPRKRPAGPTSPPTSCRASSRAFRAAT